MAFHHHQITDFVKALAYIAARKCDCAKAGKEPPPCSHTKARAVLDKHRVKY